MSHSAHKSLARNVAHPPVCILAFFVDAVSQPVVQHLISSGELPEMQRRFVSGGVTVQNAISCLPSLTYANTPSILTGRMPAAHGVLGHQWFDPDTLEAANYGSFLTYRNADRDFAGRSIYEHLTGEFTLSAQCHTRRGAAQIIDQDISTGIRWALGQYAEVDRSVGDLLPRIARIISRAERWPVFWLNYFPGVDEIAHRRGPDSPEYAAALQNVDAQIGRIAAFVDRVRGDRPTLLTLFTDHGVVASPPERRFDAIEWLARQRGARILANDRVGVWGRARLRSRLRDCEIVAFNGSYRRLALHVRPATGWGGRAGEAEIERIVLGPRDAAADALLQHPSINCVCTRLSDGGVLIRSRSGEQRIAPRPPQTPPLDVPDHLADGDRPDFAWQVASMMGSRRAGDIVCFAADDWSFDRVAAGGHGSALASDMRTSMYFSGLGLRAGQSVRAARLIDLTPTWLDALGVDVAARAAEFDGRSILRDLRSVPAEPVA